MSIQLYLCVCCLVAVEQWAEVLRVVYVSISKWLTAHGSCTCIHYQ